MSPELIVNGGTATTTRFEVWLSGKLAGELQTSREDFTKLADLVFEKNYKLSANKKYATNKKVDDKHSVDGVGRDDKKV